MEEGRKGGMGEGGREGRRKGDLQYNNTQKIRGEILISPETMSA